MAFLSSFDICASGLSAQRLRMDIASENITNIDTTRTEEGGAYRRKMVRFQSETNRDGFRQALAQVATASNRGAEKAGGVRVTEILEDQSELPVTFDPDHPDADEFGYVEMPNVTLVKEITDAMAATQAYSANVTAFNTLKTVLQRGLEIGG